MIRRFLYHVLFAAILFLLKTGKCLAQSQLTSGSGVQSLAQTAKKFEIAPMAQPSWAKKAGRPLFKVAWVSDMHLRDEPSVKASKTAFNMIRDELKANLTLITGDNCDYYKDLPEKESKYPVGVKRHLWLKRFLEKELAKPYAIIPGDISSSSEVSVPPTESSSSAATQENPLDPTCIETPIATIPVDSLGLADIADAFKSVRCNEKAVFVIRHGERDDGQTGKETPLTYWEGEPDSVNGQPSDGVRQAIAVGKKLVSADEFTYTHTKYLRTEQQHSRRGCRIRAAGAHDDQLVP